MKTMHRTQIYLTSEQQQGLMILSKKKNTSQSNLIRLSIDQTYDFSKDENTWKQNVLKYAGGSKDNLEMEETYEKNRIKLKNRQKCY